MRIFSRKNSSEKVDYDILNDLIGLSRNFMKLIFGVSIVALFVLITYISKEWKILNFIGDVLGLLSPFFIGIIIAWLFDPIVCFFQDKGVKRWIGVTFVYVLFISLLVLIGNIFIPTLIRQVNDMITAAPDLIKSLSSHIDKFMTWISRLYNLEYVVVKENFYDIMNNIFYSITVDGPSVLVKVVKAVISGGINIVLGFLIGFYMLLDFDGVRSQLSKFVPRKHRKEISDLTEKLNKLLRKYVYGTLIVMSILFIFQSIGMTIAGMPAPLVFGLFCAVTNIIPYLGPYIGGIPAVIIGFTISPSVGIGALISVLVCQLLESYLLTPTIMSKTMKLHPVTIIIGLLLFQHFFGILGMLLATPVIACGKVILGFLIDKFELFDDRDEKIEFDS